ncbi:hypothetical protein CG404_04770, partial [Bifidobacteriaceae bacterium VN003]
FEEALDDFCELPQAARDTVVQTAQINAIMLFLENRIFKLAMIYSSFCLLFCLSVVCLVVIIWLLILNID